MTTRTAHRPRTTARRLLVVGVVVALAATSLLGAPEGGAASRFDADIDATIQDIQDYWAQTMPAVYGTAYEAIPASRLVPYSLSNPPPACGGWGRMPYTEVAGNAFYCPPGDFVAWDEQELFPRLRQEFGDFAPALVLAHEWGHAIQGRVGFETYQTIYMEQQADCFAGAWTANVANGDSGLHMAEEDLDTALAGLLQLRDPSGTDGSEQGAHGNGFDRVGAFQDGYEGGAEVCADYANNPPRVTEAGYTSQADYMNGGDIGLSEVLRAVTDSLSTYWSRTEPKVVAYDRRAPECDGGTDGGVLVDEVTYCPSTDTIAYDRSTMVDAHTTIGDFAAGVLLAAGWSSAEQHRRGEPVGTSAARRAADCLTGAYTASLDGSRSRSTGPSRASDDITLSPGDLDEVVSMLVVSTSDRAAGTADRGTAFTRVSAFRKGFFRGAGAC